MQQKKSPKKPLIYYYCLVFLIVMLFNAFFFFFLSKSRVKEVPYSTFLSMVDNAEVSKVQIENGQITFTPKDENDTLVYTTGQMNDPNLIQRLEEAGNIEFTEITPQENSPIMSFLLTWLLPTAGLVLLGTFMIRSMQKRMGGNTMSFGKSSAKIYVEAQTGKTFADVAGQDEAKESLNEIVDFLHNPDK